MSSGGVPVHTLAGGTPGGPLVVFVHGLESAWSSWLPIGVELDAQWQQLALELPWRPGNDYRWRDRSPGEWLGHGLDLVGRRPDLLVAHSFGANATLELLCAHDRRVGSAAALICPMYRLRRHAVTWRMFDRARTIFYQHMSDGLRARMGQRAAAIDPAVLDAMMDVAIDRVGPLGFLATFNQFTASTDLELGSVDVPTLVVAGGADPTLAPEAAHALADAIPTGTAVVTADFDHFCNVRRPRQVAAHIARFVKALRAPTETVKGLR
jgi:pimeloyl-ACP methyl ester carboxylesterase